ncbi:hypothetical protein EDD41_0488 [Luteococcus japonicus]|uniref:Uncharacterized protein n=1 Tax=Luteococcus japonicus TaxID=33984 RepID=A0A3N1ZSJ9_9ACTN|nr:hypothetical protein [Luteococcus japonicus]ROR53347.1 hypothetical protein EDD41_0488 [Luteococcus japonicus]
MPLQLPSLTPRGQQWLENFDEQDKTLAEMLLDSLQMATTEEIQAGLRRALSDSNYKGPTLLIPVVAIEDILDLAPYSLTRAGESRRQRGDNLRQSLIAYQDFHVGKFIAGTPGSEGILGNIIRDLTNEDPSRWVAPSSSIDEVRRRRVRSCVLLTDYSGSGSQVSRMLATFARNTTFRSWHSFGWVRFHSLCYAESPASIDSLSRNKLIQTQSRVMEARTLNTCGWDSKTKAEIENLCIRKAGRKNRSQALGYAESRGMFTTEYRIPNNTPYILRKTGGGWKSFGIGEGGRQIPIEQSEVLKQKVEHDGILNHNFRGRKLAKDDTFAQKLLFCLSAYELRLPTQAIVSQNRSLSESRVHELTQVLRGLSLVDDNLRITESGRRELLRAKKRTARPPMLPKTEHPYYPELG